MGKADKIAGGEFKTLLTGRDLLVTKRGKPVAKIVSLNKTAGASLLGSVVCEVGHFSRRFVNVGTQPQRSGVRRFR